MNILWMTRRGERYVGDPITRHGFEQAVEKITNSAFAGEEWPLARPGESLEDTVKRVMPDVDWVVDMDDNLHRSKPLDLNVTHLVSDLHGKYSYGVVTPEGHIDMLNRAGYRALFLRYTELHGTSSPVDIYRRSLNPSVYWLPWSFDPDTFHPRARMRYDAAFIGSTGDKAYPLRNMIQAELTRLSETYRTFTAEAPRGGTFERLNTEKLSDSRYADILGSSNIFIFDSTVWRYAIMKFFECLGSGCLIMTTKPGGAEALGLVDERTYVEINQHNWREKLHYYLKNPGEAKKIADRGLQVARGYHTHDVRAKQFVRYLENELERNI